MLSLGPRRGALILLMALCAATLATTATAQPAAAPPEPATAPQPAPAPTGPTAKLDGYVEADYSYNFNRPSNAITNYRGFDNRHDTFTISNVVLGGTFDYESLTGRLALQVGQTPSTYYLGETTSRGTPGAASVDASTWKYIQEAHVGWKAPVGRGLLLEAGIFLSPIGYEGLAVKDNWNWSRSNLFFGLPFYHTGIHAKYDLTDRLSTMFMVCNGWNSVVDNNDWKSIVDQWIYKIPDRFTLALLYFGGPERPRGVPEGQPWRHLFDLWSQVDVTKWLSFAVNGDAGFEKNHFGVSSWEAAALYARVQPLSWLYVAARGDRFWEHAASNDQGEASRIFWPSDWVSSGTFTVDFRPHPNLSFRVEYRHDHASSDMYFTGNVQGDGDTTPYVANARYQNTVTAGVTGWF